MDNYPHYIHVVAVNGTLLELLGTESIGALGGVVTSRNCLSIIKTLSMNECHSLIRLCRLGNDIVEKNATWLILPVVICLSQRLSHACVSMN